MRNWDAKSKYQLADVSLSILAHSKQWRIPQQQHEREKSNSQVGFPLSSPRAIDLGAAGHHRLMVGRLQRASGEMFDSDWLYDGLVKRQRGLVALAHALIAG